MFPPDPVLVLVPTHFIHFTKTVRFHKLFGSGENNSDSCCIIVVLESFKLDSLRKKSSIFHPSVSFLERYYVIIIRGCFSHFCGKKSKKDTEIGEIEWSKNF